MSQEHARNHELDWACAHSTSAFAQATNCNELLCPFMRPTAMDHDSALLVPHDASCVVVHVVHIVATSTIFSMIEHLKPGPVAREQGVR